MDELIVCDLGSKDGTRDFLAEQEGPDFQVIDSSNAEPVEDWRRRNAAAIGQIKADWALILDADEFPLAPGGDLKGALARVEANLIQIPRYNMVLSAQGLPVPLPPSQADYAKLDLYVTPRAGFDGLTETCMSDSGSGRAGRHGFTGKGVEIIEYFFACAMVFGGPASIGRDDAASDAN